ncbi:Aste57867_20164 [Aphanomyces stellatus]|uniref:Aste57867_20164 protein n=1 Tax=Aphanomyces stellatus TaxID=120398 RepID=A0A485LGA9_9STRA|nr:hypothetical protein As57867_020098 [Aphanomyces stellatus]VFT96859.1 Aste57867_20164 [Aphanomyces stellatus]
MKSGTTTKRKVDEEQLLYTGKPDKPRPFKKQVVKDKCHYCHKIGHHAFDCRFKKRDLAKGITRKCMPTDEDQINILQHDDDDDEGFILATLGDVPLSDIEDAWILDSACTADVTENKALFTKLARTQPSTMQLADNSTVIPWTGPTPSLFHTSRKTSLRYDGSSSSFEIAKWDLDAAILIRETCVLRFTHHRGLYVLRPYADQINSCLVRQATPKLVQWHMRLAHLNFGAIKQAARDGVMEGLHLTKSDLAQDYSCEVCEEAKARRMSYKNTKPYRAQVPLERSNYTVMNKVRCILQASGMEKVYWGEALNYVIYTENRSPTKALGGKTPFEALYGRKPNIDHLRPFGCTAFAFIDKAKRAKLDPRAIKCVFVGTTHSVSFGQDSL